MFACAMLFIPDGGYDKQDFGLVPRKHSFHMAIIAQLRPGIYGLSTFKILITACQKILYML